MTIDFHQHPIDDVSAHMSKHQIDVSVLLPVGQAGREKARQMLVQAPEKYVLFSWVNVENIQESIGQIEYEAQELSSRGIKFQPLIQHFYPNDRRMYLLYEKCEELGLVVLFHAGIVAFYKEHGIPHLSKYTNPLCIDDIAFAFPELNIVIAHMGGNYSYEALLVAEKHENVYLDTAYLPFFCRRLLPRVTPLDLIQRAIQVLGPERVLYGGEGLMPSVIEESSLATKEKKLILHENAERLLMQG